MERNVELGMLLAYYSAFLTDRQQHMLRLHVDEDLSLGEIAEQEGISRQGVHDTVRRGIAQMEEIEKKLKHVARVSVIKKGLSDLRQYACVLEMPQAQRDALIGKINELAHVWEDEYGV